MSIEKTLPSPIFSLLYVRSSLLEMTRALIVHRFEYGLRLSMGIGRPSWAAVKFAGGARKPCGACGGALAFSRAGWLGRCDACDIEHYPRTDPAVIVAVSDGARLLLGRQAAWPPRRWSVLAGFVEPGESLEQTVVREVFEESGVRVRGCRYLASQPWPFPSSLMLGFAADADADEPVVGDELEDARWFGREEIGAALRDESGPDGLLLSPPLSISRWLIERWHEGDTTPR